MHPPSFSHWGLIQRLSGPGNARMTARKPQVETGLPRQLLHCPAGRGARAPAPAAPWPQRLLTDVFFWSGFLLAFWSSEPLPLAGLCKFPPALSCSQLHCSLSLLPAQDSPKPCWATLGRGEAPTCRRQGLCYAIVRFLFRTLGFPGVSGWTTSPAENVVLLLRRHLWASIKILNLSKSFITAFCRGCKFFFLN